MNKLTELIVRKLSPAQAPKLVTCQYTPEQQAHTDRAFVRLAELVKRSKGA